MSDTHNNDAAEIVSQDSPGEILRRERETQGLSLDDVAAALNLRPAVVAGLENDSYDQVPIIAYRRGYLRAYARLLGMDDRPVLDAYASRFSSEEPERHTTPVQVTKPPSRLGAWLFKLVTLLVIAGLIGLTLMWWQSRGGSEPPDVGDSGPVSVDRLDGTSATEDDSSLAEEGGEPPAPQVADENVEANDEPAAAGEDNNGEAPADPATEVDPATAEQIASTPVVENAANAIAVLDEGEDEGATPPDAADGEQAASDEAPAEQAASEEAAGEADEETSDDEASETTAPADDEQALELTFNEQSWTEIFDANDERIFVGLQAPGTTASVEGEPPFRLTVGNATGVELVWRGEPVDLGERAGTNNVARFTLGE